MSKQPPSAPTASAVGPCPAIIQIVGRPGTGSLPRAITPLATNTMYDNCRLYWFKQYMFQLIDIIYSIYK